MSDAGQAPAVHGRITITDVARAAGVSPATVSLVLQRKGQLSQLTRDRVLEAVAAVGYQRRPKKASRGRRPLSYCLIVDDIGNPYFHELYKGIADSIGEDTVLTLMSSEDSLLRQARILENLGSTKLNGLILVPASGTRAEELQGLSDRGIPFLIAVRNIGVEGFDYIGGNPMLGMSMAAEHLVRLGHKRIALLGGYPSNYAYHERHAGFVSTMSRNSIAVDDLPIVAGGSSKAFGRKTAAELLQLPDPPTAFIGYNDLVAIGIMNAALELGLSPGRDVAVVGYDDIPEASEQAIPLTTVATPGHNLGKLVARALLQIRDDPDHGPINITYPPTLMIRQSCGGKATDGEKK